jgi:hypothetical protein
VKEPLLVLSEGNVRVLQTKLIEPTRIFDYKDETYGIMNTSD